MAGTATVRPELDGGSVAAVRAFNRFYTRLVGALDEGLLDSPYSLAEARVLFELAQADATEVADLRQRLGLDGGYLSRLLARLEGDSLLVRQRSASDGRRLVAALTEAGRAAFGTLDACAVEQVDALLGRLDGAARRRLLGAMGAIRTLLGDRGPVASFVLRPLVPGDHGWVIERHGALYAAEYAWDVSFETLVARIVAGYLDGHDDRRETAWIVEVDGVRAGCVFCVRHDDETAQLRLLLVEPWARGAGIGARLVDECMRFARRAGYRQMTLWTNDVLVAARRIYQRAGFELVGEEPHHSFGHDLVGQTWTRPL